MYQILLSLYPPRRVYGVPARGRRRARRASTLATRLARAVLIGGALSNYTGDRRLRVTKIMTCIPGEDRSMLLEIESLFKSPPFWLIAAEIFSIPSLILYVAEAIVIHRHKNHFNSSFYRLVLIRFLANVSSYLLSYPFYRFENANLLFEIFQNLPEIFLKFVITASFYVLYAENYTTFFILLHRFTSIWRPTQHRQIWQRILPGCMAFICVAPVPFVATNLFDHTFYVAQDNNTNTFLILYHGGSTRQFLSNTFSAAFLSAVFCVVSILLNIATILIYRTRQNEHRTTYQTDNARDKIEFRLSVYALLTFCAQACMGIFMISLYYRRYYENLTHIILNLFPLVSDVCTVCVPAWLILWADRGVRVALFRALRISRERSLVANMPSTMTVAPASTKSKLTACSCQVSRVSINFLHGGGSEAATHPAQPTRYSATEPEPRENI